MSSTYPFYGNVPGQPCKRCGIPLPPNQIRCPRCGFDTPAAQPNPQSLAGGQFSTQAPPDMTSSPNAQNSLAGFPPGQNRQVPNSNSLQGMPGLNPHNTQQPSMPGRGQHPQPLSMPGIPGGNPPSQSFSGIAGRNTQAASLPNTPAPGQNIGPVSFAGMSGPGSYAPQSASFAGMARPEQQNAPASLKNVNRPQQPSAGMTSDAAARETKRKGRGRTVLLTLLLVLMVIVAATSGYVLVTSIRAGKAVNNQPSHVMNPYPALKVQPLFGDFFRNNSNQWDLDSQAGKYAAKIGGGNLTLQDMNNAVLPEFLPTSQSFANFKLMVDAEQVSGNAKNGYGVYIRASVNQQGELTTYYRLELYGDGTYAIFKGVLDANGNPNPNAVKIVSYTPDTAIHKEGTVNHIMVVANGSSITFIANNRPLYGFSDSAYSAGTIALFVSNPQDVPASVVANFSKLAVFPTSS